MASVPALERAYLRDRNPIYVWDAITQIGAACEILGRPILYPPWIVAYLTRASTEIMGIAVNRPPGNRHKPVAPTQNPDGSTTYYSDFFRGVTPPQRTELVMEALGFRGTKGATNPCERAIPRSGGTRPDKPN